VFTVKFVVREGSLGLYLELFDRKVCVLYII
jgi:hypothetical protein